MDAELFYRFYGTGHGATGAIMAVLTVIGSGWSMLGIPPFIVLRRTRGVALWLTVALVITAIAVFSLKALVGRVRPCAGLPGVHALYFAAPTDGSFPSGHAAGSFCVATYVAMVVLRTGWSVHARLATVLALGLFATGISISRVVLGVHYPFDVAAGALLGSILGALFALRGRAASVQTPSA